MFLTERFTSLLTYAIVLLITSILMRRVVRGQWKCILFLYLIALCVFAYNFKPYITSDLYRLRQYISYWTDKSLPDVFSYAIKHSAPSWVLYSYVLNKLGDTNWLQTISCLWCFGNIFYIISHEISRNETDGRGRSTSLFYVMAIGSLYLQAISGIRSMLSFSIISVCFYMETVEKKHVTIHIPLYLFAALLHSSAIPLVLIRFVFIIIQNKDIVKRIIMLVLVLVVGAFSIYYLKDYINSAFEIGQNYLFGGQEYTYIWEIIIGIIESIETIYVLRSFRRRFVESESAKEYKAIRLFCIAWTLLSLISLPFSYVVFRRYSIFASLLSVPLLIRTLKDNTEVDNNHTRFVNTIITLSMIIFVLSLVRGDLCGYKFFVL